MTHGHEQRGIAGGNGGTRQSATKRKKWDNCNSIINKISLKINDQEIPSSLREKRNYNDWEFKEALGGTYESYLEIMSSAQGGEQSVYM